MGAISEIFQNFGQEYIARFPAIPARHIKVINAISNCRSGEYGVTVYRCSGCGQTHQIATARNVSSTNVGFGSMLNLPKPYPPTISCSPSPCRNSSDPFAAPTRRPPTPPCLKRPPRQSRSSLKTRATSAPTFPVSSASCILGAEPCRTIPIFISSSRPADSLKTGDSGFQPEIPSTCRYALSPRSFAANLRPRSARRGGLPKPTQERGK